MKLMEPEVNEVVDKAVKCAEDKKERYDIKCLKSWK